MMVPIAISDGNLFAKNIRFRIKDCGDWERDSCQSDAGVRVVRFPKGDYSVT